jgi:hypothetical protein
MDTQYLDQLAHQLRIDKSPACRRAINRMFAEMKKRCEAVEYSDQTEAESAFRNLLNINVPARIGQQASEKLTSR